MLEVDTRLARSGFDLDLAHSFALEGVTAVFGPSGCGKTTLLRVIAGLEPDARGRVALGDEVWQERDRIRVPAHRRGVGLVFQDARLFVHRDVRGNLAYAERRSRTGRDAFDWDRVVDALELRPLLDRRTHGLSGGERQRVAIARTLLARPRLLLMDEPLASLDAPRRSGILEVIGELPRVFGVPVLYVTHAVDEVAELADRMLVLADGRKRMEGPTNEVLGRLLRGSDSDAFEAGALVEARVVEHDSRYHLTRLDLRGQILVMPEAGYAIGDLVRLRLRARDVALATSRPEGLSIRNVLAGRVARIDADPESPHAHITVDVGGLELRARVTREAVDALGLRPGAPVYALIKSIAVDRRRRL